MSASALATANPEFGNHRSSELTSYRTTQTVR
jgi:hypothetical protein